ncbi:MAG: RHS repeat protein, partial [Dactylosporangium sp.]|nr:RHS repeat protein [Dactylosporangium sp.]
FGRNLDGSYSPPPGERLDFVLDSGTWILRDPTGTRRLFSYPDGKLLKVIDADGREQHYTYNNAGRLATVTDAASGRALHLTWTGDRIASVSTDPPSSGARPVTWTYNYTDGLLSSACPTTSTVILHDTFDRSESGQWGTPDVGPEWVTYYSGGGTESVSSGHGRHTMTDTDTYVVSRVGDVELTDAQVWVRGVRPSATPSGDLISLELDLREAGDFEDVVYGELRFLPDGTAEVKFGSSADSSAYATVPGVTGSQPVDFVVRLVGNRMHLWAAPSTLGVDLSTSPLLSQTTTVQTSGHVHVSTYSGEDLSLPISMLIDEVTVLELAPRPCTEYT